MTAAAPPPYQPSDCFQRVSGTATRRLRAVLLLTAVFTIVEAVGGWASGSLALLADAGHMLTDSGALGLALLSAWIAQRPPDARKTYGYQRWEILAALLNGAVLFGIVVWLVIEAIHRIGNPPPVRSGMLMVVAALGLIVNLIALWLLHGPHHESLNTRGAYLHILGDLLGSVGALTAGVVIALTGWTLVDPILSIALSLLILVGAWRLMRESTDILLEAVPRHVSMDEVQQTMLTVPGVTAVHDLHVWTVTSGMVAMSGHAVVPDLAGHPDALDRIRERLARLGIGHVTIQLEIEGGCAELAEVGVRAAAHHHGPGHHHAPEFRRV
jgi:cobalt-zinc-cadmium efflux system protein